MSRWYDALPVFAQNWACDAYGARLTRLRFGKAFEERLAALMESERWPAERIAQYQDAAVRDLVKHAYEHVPFYRDRMQTRSVRPEDVRGVADLPLLPITTKADVRGQAERMRADNVPRRDVVPMHTSGTTGTALHFDIDRAALEFQWAVWWRHRMRFGVRPGEWHANFTGKIVVPEGAKTPPFWRRSRPLRQYLIPMQQLVPAKIPSLVRDLDELAPRFWAGYPSIIHSFCRMAAEQGLTLRHTPQFVFTGAENMLDSQRRDIAALTGAVLSDQYGFTEGAGNASHCERLEYHEDFEFGVLECVDGQPLDGGDTQGRIVATGFASRGFPLIRYEVGDIGVWAGPSHACSCGRASRVLRRIEGRVEDYVLTPEGRRIMRFDYLFKDTMGVHEAQIVQEKLGEIVIRMVVDPARAQHEMEALRRLVRQWISPQLAVRFEIVPELPRLPNGKIQAVVSRLPKAESQGGAAI